MESLNKREQDREAYRLRDDGKCGRKVLSLEESPLRENPERLFKGFTLKAELSVWVFLSF